MYNFKGSSFGADAGIDMFSGKSHSCEGVFFRVEDPEGCGGVTGTRGGGGVKGSNIGSGGGR